jgi:hypothetical protein
MAMNLPSIHNIASCSTTNPEHNQSTALLNSEQSISHTINTMKSKPTYQQRVIMKDEMFVAVDTS